MGKLKFVQSPLTVSKKPAQMSGHQTHLCNDSEYASSLAPLSVLSNTFRSERGPIADTISYILGKYNPGNTDSSMYILSI